MADEQRYRLKTKLPNGSEFEAEGSEAIVQALFEKFLEASQSASTSAKTPVSPGARTSDPDGTGDNDAKSAIMRRVFAEDQAGDISLLALPQTEARDADTLLMLLYGYQVLKGQQTVTVGALKQAAQKSGVQLERLDRVLAPYSAWVTKSGLKKGGRYGLNNQGIKKAEELVAGVMG
jgi:hypothetical protein